MLIEEIRQLFEQNKQKLIIEYPFLQSWQLLFDKAKTRAGACRLDEKQIVLSLWHIKNNPETIVLDTLLHEFAHAIAYQLYKDTAHGKRWKAIAKKIGASPKARGNFCLPQSPWVLVYFCAQKGQLEKVADRYRRNKKIKHYHLTGRPETQGALYYIDSQQFNLFKSGELSLQELSFFQ